METPTCNWCEAETDELLKRDGGLICYKCEDEIEARLGREWWDSMSTRERQGWNRARDEGVD